MERVDVTRAVLMVLAKEYPSPVRASALEDLVSCEGAALQRHLRLLEATGAVLAHEMAANEFVSATITESALGVMRRHPGAFGEARGRTRSDSAQPAG